MRAIELFAGAGGLGLGVSQAGFESQMVVEWNQYCCDTIRENQRLGNGPVRHWPLVEGDVRDVDFSKFSGKVNLVSGGPPCQPFSIGGKHKGFLDSRDMFPQAVRAVREVQPEAFVFENVKGLTRSSFASYFEYIRLQLTYPDLLIKEAEAWPDHLSRLERHHTQSRETGLSYRLLTRVLNAADYGVPQKRERVFFVGFRSDLDLEWCFPEPTHSQDALLWDKWCSGEYWDRHRIPRAKRPTPNRAADRALSLFDIPRLSPWVTVRDAICDLPDPETARRCAVPNHRFQAGARSYVGHTGSPLDEPAKTLKAGDHGVPGGENMLLRPDGSVRYFTVRESARIQTFPDEFVFHGSWTEAMRQLGNAVPVRLASQVAQSVHALLTQRSVGASK